MGVELGKIIEEVRIGDILIILNKKEDFQDKEFLIKNRIELLILDKKEFKKKVYQMNPQLLPIFIDGKIIYDKDNFFKKINIFLFCCIKIKI